MDLRAGPAPCEVVLVVDDNPGHLAGILFQLEEGLSGVVIKSCQNEQAAKEILETCRVDVMVCDMVMAKPESGYELVVSAKRRNALTRVIVLTAFPSVENAVRCMRAGCFDYLDKRDSHKLLTATRKALELARSRVDRESLSERLLLCDWDEIQRTTAARDKGIVLESLCTSLFRSVDGWERFESRVRSQTEEIDLVIMNESREEFWRRFGTVILVECKNWCSARRPGRKEFDSFYSKIARRGRKDCRLGFFVSLKGVAKTFEFELGRIAKEDLVVVSLDQNDLWDLICCADRSQILKEKVMRRIMS